MELCIKTAYGNAFELDQSIKLSAWDGFPVLSFSNQQEQYIIEYSFRLNLINVEIMGENKEVSEYWNDLKLKHLEETFKLQYADFFNDDNFLPFYRRICIDDCEIDYEPVIKTILTEMDICSAYAAVSRV